MKRILILIADTLATIFVIYGIAVLGLGAHHTIIAM